MNTSIILFDLVTKGNLVYIICILLSIFLWLWDVWSWSWSYGG